MCNSATEPNCYRHRVLGLLRGRFDTVSQTRPGATPFLYSFDTKSTCFLPAADNQSCARLHLPMNEGIDLLGASAPTPLTAANGGERSGHL
jgi:hypothetical protein